MSHRGLPTALVFLLLPFVSWADSRGEHSSSEKILTSIEEIKQLSVAEAASRRKVRITAVVTLHKRPEMVVQSGAAAIYADIGNSQFDVRPGDRVNIEGTTAEGMYAPIIVVHSAVRSGVAALPVPAHPGPDEMRAGLLDNLWVEVDGLIRTGWFDRDKLWLIVYVNGVRFLADVYDTRDARLDHLTGARVRLRAVCGSVANRRRQLSDVRLMVSSLRDITVLEPGGVGRSAPLEAISDLMRFAPDKPLASRVRVQGAVSLVLPGWAVYLQSGRNGIRVGFRGDPGLKVGDVVEATGFPGLGEYSPVLQDAEFNFTGRKESLNPVVVTAEEANRGDYDGLLVSLEGKLTAVRGVNGVTDLSVQQGSHVFPVAVPGRFENSESPKWTPGSRIRVLGVCQNRATGYGTKLKHFTVLSRGEADIVLVQQAPLFRASTMRRIVLGITTGAVVLLLWIGSLQSQVRRQTRIIREAMEAAERASRAKSQFLANVSHEIRTPMHGLLGMADLTLATNLSSEQHRYVETMRKSATGLLALINDLLDHARIEAGRLTLNSSPFSLRSTITEALDTFRALIDEAGLTLTCSFAPNLHDSITGAGDRVRQIVVNLTGNAVKFTESGEISVHVSSERQQNGQILVEIVVRDTGIGIPAEKLATIFEAFTQVDLSNTRKFGGTGLGLTICSELVSLMKGTIHLESQAGVGTTVTVRIPFESASAAPPTPGIAPELRAEVSPMRILVAEDNRVNQVIARSFLERAGHKATTVDTGAAAVQQFESNTFDLILMDIQMPEMDGYEATAKIRALEKARGLSAVPIVAMTAHAMAEDRDRCEEAGMNAIMTKPFTAEEVRLMTARMAAKFSRVRNSAQPVSIS